MELDITIQEIAELIHYYLNHKERSTFCLDGSLVAIEEKVNRETR